MLKNAYYFIIMKHKLNIYIVGPRKWGKTKVASKIRESLQEFREKFDIEIEESVSLANVPRQVSRQDAETLKSASPEQENVGNETRRESGAGLAGRVCSLLYLCFISIPLKVLLWLFSRGSGASGIPGYIGPSRYHRR